MTKSPPRRLSRPKAPPALPARLQDLARQLADALREARRKAHQAAAYNQWLAAEVQDAIDDPRPNISHDDVMAEMDADIAEMTGSAKLPKRKGP